MREGGKNTDPEDGEDHFKKAVFWRSMAAVLPFTIHKRWGPSTFLHRRGKGAHDEYFSLRTCWQLVLARERSHSFHQRNSHC